MYTILQSCGHIHQSYQASYSSLELGWPMRHYAALTSKFSAILHLKMKNKVNINITILVSSNASFQCKKNKFWHVVKYLIWLWWATLNRGNRKPEFGTGIRNPESGFHKSKKTSSLKSWKLFAWLVPVKKRQAKTSSDLTFFTTKLPDCEGSDYENLNKVRLSRL